MTATASFELLESILWRPARGYYLLRRHAARLRRTARRFEYQMPSWPAVCREMDAALAAGPREASKIRLLVNAAGGLTVSVTPLSALSETDRSPWRIAVARRPIDCRDPFVRHKTTQRTVYDRARAEHPRADDVLLWNQWGDVTETTLANVLFDFGGGQWLTPVADCGLLPGVFREHLLAAGRIREAVIPLERVLRRKPALLLINSVRRYIPAALAAPRPAVAVLS